MNKKIAIGFILIGIILCCYGTYSLLFPSNGKKNSNQETNTPTKYDLRIFDVATDEEKLDIISYLNSKYTNTFEVLEHTTTFCINQGADNYNGYDVDPTCSGKEIINDLYKVKDSDALIFYVKKVTVKEGVVLRDEIKDFQSPGLYDNYIITKKAKEIEELLSYRFNILGDYSIFRIVAGLGIEEPNYNKQNNSYIGYSLYSDIGRLSIDISELDNTVESYLEDVAVDKNIKLHVKYDYDITNDNFQDTVRTIVENDLVYYDYGIVGFTILIEFNNKVFIESTFNGDFITLNTYEDEVTDSFPNLLYDKTIVVNENAATTDGISYEEFMALDKSTFNF